MSGMPAVVRLLGDGKWHKAVEIYQICGVASRAMRIIAEETGAFIGGSYGYKRADLASAEELRQAARALESRVRKISRRARMVRAKIPGPEETKQLRLWG